MDTRKPGRGPPDETVSGSSAGVEAPPELRSRVRPRILSPDEAIQTFSEVTSSYTPEQAVAEARRAIAAGFDLAAARAACPFAVDIPAYLERVVQGDFDGALAIIRRAHPFPSVFGRMCHWFCERGTPRIEGIDKPSLLELERFVGDYGDPALSPVVPEKPPSGKRVAVIGAGSGGLAGAWMLRRLGHEVDVYDDLVMPGGMLFTGYPHHRMAKFGVRRENDPTSWGARFFGGAKVTRGQFAQIAETYDLTLVTTGQFQPHPIGIPGEDADGVWNALTFLGAVNAGQLPTMHRVLVLGAGQSALDASRTARRLGAEVAICYRRTMQLMALGGGPDRDASAEVRLLAAEGVPCVFLVHPVRVLVDDHHRAAGVEFIRTEVGPPDQRGQPTIVELPGTEFIMECDAVIECVGQGAELSVFPEWIRIDNGAVVVDRTDHRTSHPNVFAAGDIIGDKGNDGAALAAIQAAYTMDSVLRGEPMILFDAQPLR